MTKRLLASQKKISLIKKMKVVCLKFKSLAIKIINNFDLIYNLLFYQKLNI